MSNNRSVEIERIRYGDPVVGAEEGVEKGTLALLAEVAAQAKALAPVDTGNLRNSIGYKTNGVRTTDFANTEKLKEGQGLVGSPLEYSPYIEFGTRYMKPQPYLRPSIAIAQGQNAQEVLKKIQIEEMKGALKKGEVRESFI